MCSQASTLPPTHPPNLRPGAPGVVELALGGHPRRVGYAHLLSQPRVQLQLLHGGQHRPDALGHRHPRRQRAGSCRQRRPTAHPLKCHATDRAVHKLDLGGQASEVLCWRAAAGDRPQCAIGVGVVAQYDLHHAAYGRGVWCDNRTGRLHRSERALLHAAQRSAAGACKPEPAAARPRLVCVRGGGRGGGLVIVGAPCLV